MKIKSFYFLLYILFSFTNVLPQLSKKLDEPDLRHKIAQMVCIGFDGTTMPDSLRYDIETRGVGTVILMGRNIQSPYQLNQLVSSLKSYASIPLFVATDQEGGNVARLNNNNGYTKTKTAYYLGTVLNSTDSTAFWAGTMADWLYNAGINVDFAPVVDVDVNHSSPAIGGLERSFSSNPFKVYNHAKTFINAMSSQQILTALKHFPGHGSALTDSHNGFTDITNTWADSELVPYKKLIQDNYQSLIMSGHLFNRYLDSVYPASLSYNTLTKLLRKQLGYQGLIITDGLFMGALTQNYSFDEIVEYAINAGNDILLYTTNVINNNHSLVDSVINVVVKKIADGKITVSRIDSSYQRIVTVKQKMVNSTKEYITAQPDQFTIANYPNPFNPSTQIVYNLPSSGNVTIRIYNILGKVVTELFSGYKAAGSYQIKFDAQKLSSGIYMCAINYDGVTKFHKLLLIK